MSLDYRDVQELLRILDDTPYDELTLKTGTFTLQLARTADGKGWRQISAVQQQEGQTLSLESAREKASAAEVPPSESGLLELRSPIAGTWYHAPKPGAAPFVDVGARVEANTVVGIVEVMKLMNSIPAGVAGTVAQILVEDAGFVEKGTLLLRIKPDSA